MFGRYFPLNIDFKIRNKDYSLPILFYFLNILFCSMSFYLAFELLPVTINLRKPLCWHRLEVNRSKWPILQASLLTPGIFSSESRLLGITWVLFQCICVFTCVCFLMGGGGGATETKRRLITSSSFAVSRFHLDGPVHLERKGKK